VFTADGRELFVSTIPGSRTSKDGGSVVRLRLEDDGELEKVAEITFGAPEQGDAAKRPLAADETYAFGTKHLPIGLALADGGKLLLVALNLTNQLAVVDVEKNAVVRRIPVGNAPFGVAVLGSHACVTNFAGRKPQAGDLTGPSGVAPAVRVDPVRHIASEGSVSIVDWRDGKSLGEVVVGPHASSIVASPDGKHLVVTCANDDLAWVLDAATHAVVEKISTRPSSELNFGTSPNAAAFSPDGRRLLVACGTNNAVAVVDFAPSGSAATAPGNTAPGNSRVLGFVPVGWYPSAVVVDGARNRFIAANTKGTGSRDRNAAAADGKRLVRGEKVFGYNSHDHQGSLSLVPLPTEAELATHTATVMANNRQTAAISALSPPRPDAKPRPVPERHGEPSVFKHLIYLVKENRTYDQVFGDVERGEGDPSLCIFGREVTPNHHKLVDEFTLLDNFYCSGVLSADGHQWAMEAYVTDYLEKAFAGFPRSYPFDGGDALAYSAGGFIWDNALAHKKSLRIYGEFVKAEIGWKDKARAGKPTFSDCYADFLAGNKELDIRGTATIKTLEPYLCPTYIGFPSTVPDVYRAAEFIKEWKAAEESGEPANLSIILLPNDHTAGTRPDMPTPEAAVADNDLALGQIVEAVSRSKFWKETCIFVVQDDPQNGFDHIDGHRTVAMAISPYTRRKAVDSTNYNQTSMVRTIELVLGLPPMNQLDAAAVPMMGCFTDEADLTPYTAVPNLIPLDRLNPKLGDIRDPRQLHWAQKSIEEPLDEIDEADEDVLNRVLWYAMRRRDDTFPAWAVLADAEDEDEEEEEREREERKKKS
jgi:YVTN family beta-propeller protein